MKLRTVVRLYWLAMAILMIGWSVNLYEMLARPKVDWRGAAGIPSLAMMSITLILLTQAHRELSTDPTALVRTSASRYVIAGLAVVSLIGAGLLGLLASR